MASLPPNQIENIDCKNAKNVSFESLPKDMLREVLGLVASDSFVDLHSVKLCSKFACEIAEEHGIYQRVLLHNFPGVQWYPNAKQQEFLKLCEESGNMDIVFSEGLRRYFNNPDGDVDGSGLNRLKIAAENGHKSAKYMYGMIKICSEDEDSRKEGIEHLRTLRMSRCLVSTRDNLYPFTHYLWKHFHNLVRNQTHICKSKDTCNGWKNPVGVWHLGNDDDDDLRLCESCRWDYELSIFYRVFGIN